MTTPTLTKLVDDFLTGLAASLDPETERVEMASKPVRTYSLTVHDPLAITCTPEFRDYLIPMLKECGLTDIHLFTVPTRCPRMPRSPFKYARNKGHPNIAMVRYLCSIIDPLRDVYLFLTGAQGRYREALRKYEELRRNYDPQGWTVNIAFSYAA